VSDYRIDQLKRILFTAIAHQEGITMTFTSKGVTSKTIGISPQEADAMIRVLKTTYVPKSQTIKFGYLPDEEKARIFLAWCNGAEIEFFDTDNTWKTERPEWYPENPYRIKESHNA